MPASTTSRPLAFVLMPFEPAFDAIFERLIQPALEEAGYAVRRADRLDTQQNVLKDVIQGIALADLVVADVTGLNPNVLYELGVAHALARPTVMLTQNIDEVPFDLRSCRVISYTERFDAAAAMMKSLSELAAGQLRGEVQFGNPAANFAPAASDRDAGRNSAGRPHGIEAETKGFLDLQAESQTAMDEISRSLGVINSLARSHSERLSEKTEEFRARLASGVPMTVADQLAAANDHAVDFGFYAEDIETEAPILRRAWEAIGQNQPQLVEMADLSDSGTRAAFASLRSQLLDFKDTTVESDASQKVFVDQLASLRKMNISQRLSAACSRAESAFVALSGALTTGVSTIDRVVDAIDGRFGAELAQTSSDPVDAGETPPDGSSPTAQPAD